MECLYSLRIYPRYPLKIAEDIRQLIDGHNQAFPTVLEIPSKDHPYGKSENQTLLHSPTTLTLLNLLDPEKDSVLKRVRRLFGE